MSTSPSDLLQRGIAAARAGHNDVARQLIARAIQADPRNEQAWLWLSSVAENDEERVRILQQVVKINPENEYALRGLEALGALPQVEPQPEAPASQPADEQIEPLPTELTVGTSVSNAPPPPAPDGVPLVGPEILDYVRDAVGIAVQEVTEQRNVSPLNVTWVPTRKRLRQRRGLPFALDPLVAGAVLGGIILLGALGYGVFRLAGVIRGAVGPQGAAGVGVVAEGSGETATPTIEPTPTLTLVPGEATFTPEATIALDVPHGDLDFGVTLTPPYFATVHPDNPRLDQAIALYYEGDHAGVVEAIPLARESGPDLPDSYFFEGMSHAHLGDYNRAVDVINDGLAQDPNSAALHAALGYVYLQQGALDEARAENAIAKQLDPALVMPYLTLAEDFREEGLFDEAQAEVNAALQLAPHNVEVLVADGLISIARGSPEIAAATGNLAVYIDPTSEGAVLLLGQARIALEQYGQAIFPLQQYLGRVDPESAAAWAMLGDAFYRQGSQQQAVEAFSRALALAGDSNEALVYRGTLYLQTGEFESAFTDFDEAVSLADTPEARLGRGQSAISTGRPDVALGDAETVLESEPLNRAARLLRGKALVELERYNEALEALNQVLGQGLDDASMRADAFDYRGRANYNLTLYADALVDLETAMALEETGTRHYYRGLILEAIGNVEEAILEYDWVLFWERAFAYPFTEEARLRRDNLTAGGRPQGSVLGETFVPSPTPITGS